MSNGFSGRRFGIYGKSDVYSDLFDIKTPFRWKLQTQSCFWVKSGFCCSRTAANFPRTFEARFGKFRVESTLGKMESCFFFYPMWDTPFSFFFFWRSKVAKFFFFVFFCESVINFAKAQKRKRDNSLRCDLSSHIPSWAPYPLVHCCHVGGQHRNITPWRVQ